jgi:NAD(P)-dependent dehydrogenase (short-subunit alcohol dehydrogenase family)
MTGQATGGQATDGQATGEQLRFDDEVAIVTGGGRGIGARYARMLADRGAKVVVNDLGAGRHGEDSPDRPADQVVAEIRAAGGEAVADDHDVRLDGPAVVERAVAEYGRVDIVLNNAGNLGRNPFGQVPLEQLDLVLGVHVRGSFAVTQAAWPHLVASGRGRVLFTSSQASFGAPGSICYSIAKSALIGFTNTLALEGASHGVRTNAIMPAAWTRLTSDTPQADISSLIEGFFDADYVAAFVVWLNHRATDLNGQVFCVGGGRSGKVFLAEVPGVTTGALAPEGWVGHAEELVTVRDYERPGSMVDELGFQAASLGGPVADAWQAIVGG